MGFTQPILDDHAEQRRLIAIHEQLDPKDTVARLHDAVTRQPV